MLLVNVPSNLKPGTVYFCVIMLYVMVVTLFHGFSYALEVTLCLLVILLGCYIISGLVRALSCVIEDVHSAVERVKKGEV